MSTLDEARAALDGAFPDRDERMTDRALAFFENLINSITLTPAQENFDDLVAEIRHGREEIVAERVRRT